MKGKIKNLKVTHSFGFIRSNGTDYFFHREGFNGHWNDLVQDFKRDIKIEVEFDMEESNRGPRACNVRRLDFPNEAV